MIHIPPDLQHLWRPAPSGFTIAASTLLRHVPVDDGTRARLVPLGAQTVRLVPIRPGWWRLDAVLVGPMTWRVIP